MFDSGNFLEVDKVDIPGIKGAAGPLIRWGNDGLAFGTSSDQVFLIQGSMISQPTNLIDQPGYFVQQQYLDFLSREPDQQGFDYWVGQITQCGNDETCLRTKRIDVSNAFFFELAFSSG